MGFPTPYTVGWHARISGGADPFMDPPTFTPPKDEPGTAVPVHGWHVPSTAANAEPKMAGHPERVVVDIELFAPVVFQPGPHDLVDLPTGQYEVLGETESYATGPWEWAAGVVINLRKVDG
ncbi:hypothetical protein [Nocardia sp. NPDC055049]